MSVLVPTVVPCVSTATSRQKRSKDSPRRSAAMRIAASMPSAKFSGVDGDLVAVILPPRSSTTQSVNVPPMSTPTRRLATLLLLPVELEGVVRVGVYLHAALRRLHVATDHVQALAEDGTRQSVTRYWHRRQYCPSVACRIVCLQRAKRVHPLAILPLAARDINAPAID